MLKLVCMLTLSKRNKALGLRVSGSVPWPGFEGTMGFLLGGLQVRQKKRTQKTGAVGCSGLDLVGQGWEPFGWFRSWLHA